MLNSFKATVRKRATVPFADLCNYFAWCGHVEMDNPGLLVASAANECGETCCYTTAEAVFVVNNYAFSPKTTPSDAMQAGIALDGVLATEGQRAGVSKLLIVVPEGTPKNKEERRLRVIERKIPSPDEGLGCSAPSSVVYQD